MCAKPGSTHVPILPDFHTNHTAPIFKEYRFKLKSARALSELNHLFGVEHTSNLLKLTKTDRIHTHTDTTLSLKNGF